MNQSILMDDNIMYNLNFNEYTRCRLQHKSHNSTTYSISPPPNRRESSTTRAVSARRLVFGEPVRVRGRSSSGTKVAGGRILIA